MSKETRIRQAESKNNIITPRHLLKDRLEKLLIAASEESTDDTAIESMTRLAQRMQARWLALAT